MTINSLGNVGIGTSATPSARLDVEGDWVRLPILAGQVTGVVNIVNTTGTEPIEVHSANALGAAFYTHSNTGFRGPEIDLYRSEGTQASPQAVNNSDVLGYLNWFGYDGSTYTAGNGGGGIEVYATGNWSSTSHPSTMKFLSSAPTGLVLDQFGQFGINSTTPAAMLSVRGISGSTTPEFIVASSSNAVNLIVTSGGNVGIGTTTPGHLITLSGGAFSDGATWSNVRSQLEGQLHDGVARGRVAENRRPAHPAVEP